jgi:multicomponent Na+:H+ antiporter subunit C
MQAIMVLLIGLMAGVSAYLMLSGNLVRFLIGLGLLSNAVNLAIFEAGRLSWAAPPLIEAGAKAPEGAVANALPQALILTAIVIGFGLLAFALVLVYRFYGAFGTVEIDDVAVAEPRRE